MPFIGTNEQPQVIIDAGISGSNSHARVSATTNAVLILSASEFRTHASVFNHSPAGLYIGFGMVPTINFFDVKLASGTFFEIQRPIWRAEVYGVWDAASGFAMIHDVSGSIPD